MPSAGPTPVSERRPLRWRRTAELAHRAARRPGAFSVQFWWRWRTAFPAGSIGTLTCRRSRALVAQNLMSASASAPACHGRPYSRGGLVEGAEYAYGFAGCVLLDGEIAS